MNLLESMFTWIVDLIITAADVFGMSVISVLRADLTLFMQMFPIVETTYSIFLGFAMSFIALSLTWNLVKNFFGPIGVEAEPPFHVISRHIMFGFLTWFSWPITETIVSFFGEPYNAIMGAAAGAAVTTPPFREMLDAGTIALAFGFTAGLPKILLVISIVGLVFVLIIAWNYIKLLIEAIERYLFVGILAFTAPLAFAMGASQSTLPIFKSWCRMLASQMLLLVFTVWTLRMFMSLLNSFLTNPMMFR